MPVIKKHENIVDFSVTEYGTVEALFLVATWLDGSITDDVTPGVMIPVQASDVSLFKDNAGVMIPVIEKPDIHLLKKHQNYADFITQHAGTFEGIFELAMLNGISFTKQSTPGEILKVEVREKKVAEFYKQSGYIVFSEEDRPEDFTGQPPGGIGYMEIERTFIVS